MVDYDVEMEETLVKVVDEAFIPLAPGVTNVKIRISDKPLSESQTLD